MSLVVAPIPEMEQLSEEKRQIEERQKKLQELQKITERLFSIKDLITRLEKERAVARVENGRHSPAEYPEYHQRFMKIESELQALTAERAKLEEREKQIRSELPAPSKISKHKVLRNIRVLMKIKGVKVGQVEKESGNSPGYMSRLEREGNTTSPTLEFVATAAEMLGVSMELLLYGDIEELSSTDLYLLEFLSELMASTESGDSIWQLEDLESKAEIFFSKEAIPTKPKAAIRCYKTLFRFDNVVLYEESPALSVLVQGGGSRLFIIPVMGQFEPGPASIFVEVYLVDEEGKRTPLFNTHDCNETLSDATGALYEAAIESARSIQLADSAKDVIDQFLKIRKGGED